MAKKRLNADEIISLIIANIHSSDDFSGILNKGTIDTLLEVNRKTLGCLRFIESTALKRDIVKELNDTIIDFIKKAKTLKGIPLDTHTASHNYTTQTAITLFNVITKAAVVAFAKNRVINTLFVHEIANPPYIKIFYHYNKFRMLNFRQCYGQFHEV